MTRYVLYEGGRIRGAKLRITGGEQGGRRESRRLRGPTGALPAARRLSLKLPNLKRTITVVLTLETGQTAAVASYRRGKMVSYRDPVDILAWANETQQRDHRSSP